MKSILLTFLLLFAIISTSKSQNIKHFKGDYENGKAAYSYYENENHERIYHGNFKFIHTGYNVVTIEKGKYVNNLKNGQWTIIAKEDKYLLSTTTLNYTLGKLNGDFSHISSSVISKRNKKTNKYRKVLKKEKTVRAHYKDNVQVGLYEYKYYDNEYNKENISLTYHLSDFGLLDGKFEYIENDLIRITDFKNGYLLTDLYRQKSTGELISNIDQTDNINFIIENLDPKLDGTIVPNMKFSEYLRPIIDGEIEYYSNNYYSNTSEATRASADSIINDFYYYNDKIISDSIIDIDKFYFWGSDNFRSKMHEASFLSNDESYNISRYYGSSKGIIFQPQFYFKVPSISILKNEKYRASQNKIIFDNLGKNLFSTISFDTIYYIKSKNKLINNIGKEGKFFLCSQSLNQQQINAKKLILEYLDKGKNYKFIEHQWIELNDSILNMSIKGNIDKVSFEFYKQYLSIFNRMGKYNKPNLNLEYSNLGLKKYNTDAYYIFITDVELKDPDVYMAYQYYIQAIKVIDSGDKSFNENNYESALLDYQRAERMIASLSLSIDTTINEYLSSQISLVETKKKITIERDYIVQCCKEKGYQHFLNKYNEIYKLYSSGKNIDILLDNYAKLEKVNSYILNHRGLIMEYSRVRHVTFIGDTYFTDNAKKINRKIKKTKDITEAISVIKKYGPNH